jgi:predicted phosphoribosyltransferase
MADRFADRRAAGRALAARVRAAVGPTERIVVLALPRGGVPVGVEVASALQSPLDVFVVRKLGVPGHEELAMGAIASGGTIVRNEQVLAMAKVTDADVDAVIERERTELARREASYRGGRKAPDLRGATVVLVDDGLATGSTMRAAVLAVRQHEPARVVVAVPVGAPRTCEELGELADDVVCAIQPRDFAAVGQWYADFAQTTDDEVQALLGEVAVGTQS